MLRTIDPSLELKYNKFYIGLAKDGQPNNFVLFRAKKENLRVELRLDQSEEVRRELDEASLDLMDYDNHSGRYRIRLTPGQVSNHKSFLTKLLRLSYEQYG